MDNRIAWRLVDFWKDIFMHHRKFTPFQKLVFLTFLVGILIGIFRNLSSLCIAVTYAAAIYLSVSVAGVILKRRTFLPSDVLVENFGYIQIILSDFLQKSGRVENESGLKRDNDNSLTASPVPTDNVHEDQYFDAPEHMTNHIPKISLTPKKHQASPSRDKDGISKEIDLILNHIHRDFILSWYKLFSSDEEGLMEAEILLHNIFVEIRVRLRKLDRFELANIIMVMFSNHIHKVKQARLMLKVQKRRRRSSGIPKVNSENSLPSLNKISNASYKTVEECFGAKSELHPAVRNKELEQMYQKSVVEIVLFKVLEENFTETKALICALKEILMCNVLQSVISLLSDTIFLHEKIIQITSDEQLFSCKENEDSIHVVENHSKEKLKSALNSGSKSQNDNMSHSTSEERFDRKSDISVSGVLTEKSCDLEEKPSSSVQEETPKDIKWRRDTKEFIISKGMCNECNRLCSKDKDKISPRPHTCSLGTTPVFFDADRLSVDSFESLDSLSRSASPVSDSEKVDIPCTENIPGIRVDGSATDEVFEDHVISAKTSPDQAYDGQITPDHNDEESNNTAENESKNVPNMLFNLIPNPLNAIPLLRKRSTSGLNARNRSSPSLESSEEKLDSLSVRKSISADEMHKDQLTPTTPVDDTPWPTDISVFQDIRITGTETAKEPNGSTVYTLYLIEYEALYRTEEDLVHRTGSVKRRFREFVNLQSRLEDNSVYKDSLRDVKGPKKLIPSLPFGNMGKDTLENRKKLLETFLSTLINRPVICNGSELKQFLGYSGDGHIAFVRKNPEANTRIDQRLVKTMSGVFDKIVEGFPSLPPQLPRIMTSSNIKDDREEEDKPLEDLDQLEIDISCDHCKSQQKVDSGLDKFMERTLFDLVTEDEEHAGDATLGVSVLEWQEKNMTTSPEKHGPSCHHPPTQAARNDQDVDSCPLTNAVLDILAELLSGQDSWMCRDNVTHSTKILLGKALNRYLQSKVEKLTSDEMNMFYLRTLRDALWPNGQLDTEPRPVYTDGQKEKLKLQATRCLSEFLPGVLQSLLGEEDFSHLIDEVFQTIQYEKLNRHFWYSVIDILLEKLFPEVSTTDLQRKLSMLVLSNLYLIEPFSCAEETITDYLMKANPLL